MSCNDPSCSSFGCDCTHAYCECKPPPIEKRATVPTEEAKRRFEILLDMEKLVAEKTLFVMVSHEELKTLLTMIKED